MNPTSLFMFMSLFIIKHNPSILLPTPHISTSPHLTSLPHLTSPILFSSRTSPLIEISSSKTYTTTTTTTTTPHPPILSAYLFVLIYTIWFRFRFSGYFGEWNDGRIGT
ncbi:hypothetical protein M430DRAFT_35110 [Amorphotheca resinae ATCC 22711]|uniref:Uncharacterized protein n=1 Tax=Amorphotheca resinae ATCC 22711 TaxID=857342 RepID=A0A2T3B254_AMORE|nr:hypothetical protein M430DRAFT_35110 [Amorphotheca resinae ATCC 22711]PSS18641.1 hypothetical protein M430DRAFT_35110 [Amorphotheca resinae ATCC 22711]